MTFKDYDKRGVRGFTNYQDNTGLFSVSVWRKKTKHESKGEHDFRMIPIFHIQSYFTREEAEKKALEICEEICAEFNL